MPQSTQKAARTGSQKGSDTDIPRLSCELCRERKVRCDKASPHCTNCVKAGMACVPVYRKRYSRGRHTARRNLGLRAEGTVAAAAATAGVAPQQIEDDDLRDRVRRLECMISNMNHERQDDVDLFGDTSASQTPPSSLLFGLDPTPSRHVRGHINTHTSTESRPERYVKQHFWTDLVEEVCTMQYCLSRSLLVFRVFPYYTDREQIQGLRGVLEPGASDEKAAYVANSPDASSQSPLSSRAGSVLGLGYPTTESSQISTLTSSIHPIDRPALVAQLCHVYSLQVDPIVKILHRPTLSAFLIDSQGFLDYDIRDSSPAALRAAVCYAAVVSMTEEQCQATFSSPKLKVLPEFRNACDVALNRAGLLTTADITVLQAFVLYLVSRLFLNRMAISLLVQRLLSRILLTMES